MTEEEYKDYLELKKQGFDVSELEKDVDAFLRDKESREAGESGSSGGTQAPFVDGVDWVSAYRSATKSKKAPTDEELADFRENIGARVTGLSRSKVRKRTKSFIPWQDDYYRTVTEYTPKKGDPSDIWSVAVDTGFYPEGDADKAYFGDFLRLGNVSDKEAGEKVKSGEWDKDMLGEWERAKAFGKLLDSSRRYITKESAKADARNDSDFFTESVFPSSVRSLKEGDIPKGGQIASDFASTVLTTVPATRAAGVVFPTLGALLAGANEYGYNDAEAGDAVKDAGIMALLGSGANNPWIFRNLAGAAGLSSVREGAAGALKGLGKESQAQVRKAMADADRIAELVGSNAAEGKLGIRKATKDWDADMTAKVYNILKDEGNQFADAFVSMKTGAGMTSAAAERFDTAARASVGEPVRDALVDALVEAAEAGDENAIKALPELEQFNRESGDRLTRLLFSPYTKKAKEVARTELGLAGQYGGRPALRAVAVQSGQMAEPSKAKRSKEERLPMESDEEKEKRWELFTPRVSETEVGDYINRRYNLFKGIK